MGKSLEQLSPLFPRFRFAPRDLRTMGDPIDFIVFDGMSKNDFVKKIVFLEVKSGHSILQQRQRSIRDCIEDGHIEFSTYTVPKGILK